MSLLNDASLIVTPNGYKGGVTTGKLYSVKPTNGDGDMDVTRNTTSTRVNSAGLIQSVAFNAPRIDYPPLGGCPRILVEPQRTNNILYSEEFDNASWNKSDATISANATISPNGTLIADKLIEGTSNGQHYTNRNITNSNSLFSFSIFAKKSERNFLYLNAFATNLNNFTYVPSAYFDLDNGTVGTVSSATATIQDYGNGWYRCTLNCTSIFPQTSTTIGMYIMSATSNGNSNYLGNGTSGIFIWGAQAEVGSNATSYIPTTTIPLVRNADVISKTGITNLIGQTEGTLYVEVNLDNFEVNNVRIFAISDGTSANRIMLLTNSSNRITTIASNSSVEQAQISSGTLTKGLYKIAVAYAFNDFAFYINGALIGVDPSINVPICTDVYLGKIETSSSTAILNDTIELAALFKTRLTEDQCKDLTT